MPTEGERAAQYRRDQQAGESARLARYRGLAGQASAYQTRLAQTEALRRDEGWDPVPLLADEEREQIGG